MSAFEKIVCAKIIIKKTNNSSTITTIFKGFSLSLLTL